MQAQQAISLRRRSFSTMVAVLATAVAAVLALALMATVDRPATSSTPTVVTLHSVTGEQVAHNRSEEGQGTSGSVDGEQIAHTRSEEGFGTS